MDAVLVPVLNLALLLIVALVLYFVVRRGVRDGMVDAWAKRDAAADETPPPTV